VQSAPRGRLGGDDRLGGRGRAKHITGVYAATAAPGADSFGLIALRQGRVAPAFVAIGTLSVALLYTAGFARALLSHPPAKVHTLNQAVAPTLQFPALRIPAPVKARPSTIKAPFAKHPQRYAASRPHRVPIMTSQVDLQPASSKPAAKKARSHPTARRRQRRRSRARRARRRSGFHRHDAGRGSGSRRPRRRRRRDSGGQGRLGRGTGGHRHAHRPDRCPGSSRLPPRPRSASPAPARPRTRACSPGRRSPARTGPM
jgi:hypothetical protein